MPFHNVNWNAERLCGDAADAIIVSFFSFLRISNSQKRQIVISVKQPL